MNNVQLLGRLTKDPELKQAKTMTFAKFVLAVDRKYKKEGEQTADFIGCTAFGKQAEVICRYLGKGRKVLVEGRIQTGNYKNSEGITCCTWDVIVENFEFVDSKADSNEGEQEHTQSQKQPRNQAHASTEGFMEIPEGEDEDLPFI